MQVNCMSSPPPVVCSHSHQPAPAMAAPPGGSRDDRYTRGGAAGIEGSLYQVKLLTLFLFRGIKRKYDFKLATEMTNAHKFDDLIFHYNNIKGERESIVLQAKHRLDATSTINIDNLLSPNSRDDFSLAKYFSAYQKIKKDESFGHIKHAVLFTNIDLDANCKQYMEKHSMNDDLFSLEDASPGRAYYKITAAIVSKLTPVLEDADLCNVTENIVNNILEGTPIRVQKDNQWEKYFPILKQEIFVVDKGAFIQFKTCLFDPILGDSQTKLFLKHLHSAICRKQEKFKIKIKSKIDDYEILCAKSRLTKAETKQKEKLLKVKEYFSVKLSDDEYNFNLSDLNYYLENFSIKIPKDKQTNPCSDPITWPEYKVPVEDIEEFSNCFVLAVKQPNEVELSKIIEKDIGPDFGLNNLTTEYAADYLQKKMLEWFKTLPGSKKNEGIFYNTDKGVSILEELTKKVNAMSSVAQSAESWENVQAGNVEFQASVLTDIQTLLASEKKIFHLTSSSNGLVMMKLFYALEDPRNKYLHIKSESLSSRQSQSRIISSFKMMNYSGIIIESSQIDSFVTGVTRQLCQDLNEVLIEDSEKVFILVTPEDSNFIHPLSTSLYSKFELQHSFEDLVEEHKRKLDSKRILNFQGTLTDLKSLFDEDTFPLIDSSTLYQLINNEIVFIGQSSPLLKDLDSAYIKIFENISQENIIKALKSCGDTLYLVSGFFHHDIEKIREQLIGMLGNEFNYLLQENISLYSKETTMQNGFKILLGDRNENQKDFHLACEHNPSLPVYWIYVSSDGFLLQHLHTPHFYIPRDFSYQEHFIMDVNKLKSHILQSDSDKYNFIDTDGTNLMNFFCIENESEENIFYSKLCNGNQFKVLNNGKCSVHQFIITNGQIIWNGSSGNLEALRECIDDNKAKKITCSEKKIKDIKDRIIIISDQPGMGKTTTLASLSEHMLSSHWVIRINFKDCYSALVQLPNIGEMLCLDDVMQFLSVMDGTGLSHSLTREVLKQSLQQERALKKGILFLFDGFDEIGTEEQGRALLLLIFLKENTSARIWITTRPYMEHQLENCLSTFCFKLQPLTVAQQKDFLTQYWLDRFSLKLNHYNNLKLSSLKTDLKSLASRLLSKTNFLFGGQLTTLMGIPLQLRLLAEGFQAVIFQLLRSSTNSNDPFKSITILDLYEHFIKENYSTYFREKINFNHKHTFVKDILSERFNRFHQYKAFELLFCDREDFLNNVFSSEEISLIKTREDDIKSIGIIQAGIGKTVTFVHRTMSEYFVATLFVSILYEKNLNFPALKEKLITILYEEMFEDRNQVIRKFMDQMLAKNLPVHFAVINNKFSSFDLVKCTSTTDALGRTALHLAVQYGTYKTVQRLLVAGCDARLKDSFGKTALHYVSIKSEKQSIKCLLEYYSDIDISDYIFSRPLLMDREVGDNIFNKSEYEESQLIKFVNTPDIGGKDALHYAVKSKYFSVVGLLLKCGAYVHSLNNLTEHWGYFIQFDLNTRLYLFLKSFRKFSVCNGVIFLSTIRGHTKVLEEMRLYNPNFLSLKENYWPMSLLEDNVILSSAKWFESTSYMSEMNLLEFFKLSLQGGLLNTFMFLMEECGGKNLEKNICNYVDEAVYRNHHPLVNYLWINFRENTTDDAGNTALHRVVITGKVQFVKYFCENGTEVNKINFEGKTPLHLAIEYKQLDIIMYLRSIGGIALLSNSNIINIIENILIKSENHFIKFVQLRIALNGIDQNRSSDVIEELCNKTHMILQVHQDEINTPTQNGDSLLHIAMETEVLGLVEYLMDQGANINYRDKKGKTAMEKVFIQGCKNEKFTNSLVGYCVAKGAIYESRYFSQPYLLLLHRVFHCRNIPQHFDEEYILNVKRFSNINFMEAVNSKVETLLHIYAQNGNLAAIEIMFKNLPSSSQDILGNTPLHLAAQRGHMVVARWLLQHGAIFNGKNLFGHTPDQLARQGNHNSITKLITLTKNMYNAIIGNRTMEVREYFSSGVNVNSRDNSGMYPLHWAAYCGYDDLAQELLNCGAIVDATDVLQRTALQIAAARDNMDVLYTLLMKGASFNLENESRIDQKNNAGHFLKKIANMFLQVQVGNINDLLKELQIVKQTNLRAFNAIINTKSNKKLTLLSYAVEQNKLDVVFFLLENGSPFAALEDQVKKMPPSKLRKFLMFIVLESGGDKDIIMNDPRNQIQLSTKMFEDCPNMLRAIVNYRDCNGLSILHISNSYYALKYFINKGCDVNARDTLGRIPIHCAAEKGKLCNVMLLQQKSDLNTLTFSGDSVLHYACYSVNEDLVEYLISLGAKVNISNHQMNTPLHMTVFNLLSITKDFKDYTEIRELLECVLSTLDILLKKNSKIDSKNKDGFTALDIAISAGHLSVVEKLIEYGATLDASSLRRAIFEGHFHIIKWLIDHDKKLIREDLIFSDIISSNCFNIFRWLKRHGPNIECRASEDCAIFQVETKIGLECFMWLISMNSEVCPFSQENLCQDVLSNPSAHHKIVIKWLSMHEINIQTIIKRNGTVFQTAVLPANVNFNELKHDLQINHHWLRQIFSQDYTNDNKILIILCLPKGVINLFLMFNKINEKSYDGIGNEKLEFFKEEYLNSALGLSEEDSKLNLMKWLNSHCQVDLDINSDRGTSLLSQASKKGYLQIVQWLISLNTDKEWLQNIGKMLIHDASKYGHLRIVEWLTAQGVDVAASAPNGSTALQAAVSEGHYHLIKWLVDHGALNEQEKGTILHKVLSSTRLDITGWLTEYCCQNNFITINNSRMCLQSTVLGFPLIIQENIINEGQLLRSETNMDQQAHTYFNKLLNVESITQNILCNVGGTLIKPTGRVVCDVIKWLTSGVSGQIIKSAECSVIIRDITYTVLDLMKWFVDNGAKVQDSLLHTAASGGHLKVMQWLVEEYNLSILGVAGDKGRSCLHEAVTFGDLDMVVWLESNGADIHIRTLDEKNLFHEAAKYGHFHIMYWLIDYNMEIDSCSEDGTTPLLEAVPLGNVNLLKWMVERGADVKKTTTNGMSALHIAASFGHFHTVKWLIEKGLDINGITDGRTPLHEAFAYGSVDVAELLYTNGATLNIEALRQEATDQEHMHMLHWLNEKSQNSL